MENNNEKKVYIRNVLADEEKEVMTEHDKKIAELALASSTKYNKVERLILDEFEREMFYRKSPILKNESEKKMNQKRNLIIKINEMLKSEATTIVENLDTQSSEERKTRLEAIEEIKHYIDHYDENMKIIQKAKEDELCMIDDGR